MKKTYRANTNVSINIVLETKKNLHISFVPLSDGSSTFTTDKADVQKGIERHYNFDKLFALVSVQDEPIKIVKKVVAKQPMSKESEITSEITLNEDVITEPCEESAEGTDLKQITVSDIATAKDYLADNCGVSRTKMRSTKAILEAANANGIEFVGI